MKKTVVWFVLLTIVFLSRTAAGGDIWTLGRSDNDHREFSVLTHEEFLRDFSEGATIRLGEPGVEKQLPAEHPGPVDTWAGKKIRPFTIRFDLNDRSAVSAANELVIVGWPSFSAPPVFNVRLNEYSGQIETKGVENVDPMRVDPTQTKTGVFRLVVPPNSLKEKGNELVLEIVKGSWFVYDVVRFKPLTTTIEQVSLTAERGVFRNPVGGGATRKINVDYHGEVLDKPAVLVITGNFSSPKQEITLNPTEHFSSASFFLPIDEKKCEEAINLSGTLTINDRQLPVQATIPGERKWELHVIHQTHLDVGYTDTQLNILEWQIESIKKALRYIEETKDYPDEAKFKFHLEGFWAVEEFLRRASDEEKETFAKATRSRDLHMDALYSQGMTGLFSDEQLFELMSSALRYGKENNVVIDSAMFTDIPGLSWGVVPVLAKCGVKYVTMGPNRGHRTGRVYEIGDKPFYWVSPSGKDKILCYVHITGYGSFHGRRFGDRLTTRDVFRVLDGYQIHSGRPYENQPHEMPYDIVGLRHGIEGDNGQPNRVLSDDVKEWNEKYIYPKLILSRNSDFMKALEDRYGSEFATLRGDYTPYWEDGAASTSEATALCRDAKERLVRVEAALATADPATYLKHIDRFDAAWTDLLMYDEHTWGSSYSVREPDREIVKIQDDFKQEYARRGHRNVLAMEKEFNIKTPGKSQPFPEAGKAWANAENGTIGNDLLTIRVDEKTGAIVSLKRKGIDNDLVNPGAGGNAGLNDYLYIIGRNPERNRSRHTEGVQLRSVLFPGGAMLEMRSAAPNCNSLLRTVSVFDGRDDVEIANTLDKKLERRQEGTFFAFPFNVPEGIWRYDTPWATVRVEQEQLKGSSRNFYCVQRLCNISNDSYGIDWVTVDAPMVQFDPILFTIAWPRTLEPWRDRIEPNDTIYSWVCNNHWETNYKAEQGGILQFRYRIRPYLGKYSPENSQQFARGIANGNDLASKLVKIDNNNIIITRAKPVRDGGEAQGSPGGLFLRLYNPTDQPQSLTLQLTAPQMGQSDYSARVYFSNPLEERGEKISGAIVIDPYDIIMLRAE